MRRAVGENRHGRLLLGKATAARTRTVAVLLSSVTAWLQVHVHPAISARELPTAPKQRRQGIGLRAGPAS